MKKIVFLSLFALALPLVGMMAQSNDDDLYFIPSKEKAAPAPVKRAPAKREVTTNIYTSPGTTVVVQDRKGKTRDVDEYNRRYEARDNEFVMEDDTLFVKEKARPDLDGEWVNGEFNGSREDYEYAERIIRFRNPRYAISISSPLYWDVVYGSNSWDWNVYTDGLYAYAFPTFSNRLWWDWRFNSYGPSWGFGFGSPYYAGSYWGGWYGSYWGGGWGGYWGHHHHHGYYPGWGGGGYYPGWGGGSWDSNRVYTNRRSSGSFDSSRRPGYGSGRQDGGSVRRGTPDGGRVVGTRVPTSTRSSSDRVNGTRGESVRSGVSSGRDRDASVRRSTYTRPSSTRSSEFDNSRRESVRSRSESTGSYNRGSSTEPTRSYSGESTRRSYDNSSSTRSYSPSNSSSSRSSGSFSGGGGGSSRSSSGGGGSSRSGGGSSRR